MAKDNIVFGNYVSAWDGGLILKSNAQINLKTKEIFVEDYYPDFGLNVLEDEFVIIDEVSYPCCNINELNDYEDKEMFWYR